MFNLIISYVYFDGFRYSVPSVKTGSSEGNVICKLIFY